MNDEIDEKPAQPKTLIATPSGEIDAALVKNMPTREFRAAWRLDGEVIKIDLEAAREIHKTRLRAARVTAFAALDVDRYRAIETGSADMKDIRRRAAELRDVTDHPDLLSAKTPDQITAFWPTFLGKR